MWHFWPYKYPGKPFCKTLHRFSQTTDTVRCISIFPCGSFPSFNDFSQLLSLFVCWQVLIYKVLFTIKAVTVVVWLVNELCWMWRYINTGTVKWTIHIKWMVIMLLLGLNELKHHYILICNHHKSMPIVSIRLWMFICVDPVSHHCTSTWYGYKKSSVIDSETH